MEHSYEYLWNKNQIIITSSRRVSFEERKKWNGVREASPPSATMILPIMKVGWLVLPGPLCLWAPPRNAVLLPWSEQETRLRSTILCIESRFHLCGVCCLLPQNLYPSLLLSFLNHRLREIAGGNGPNASAALIPPGRYGDLDERHTD